MNEAEEVGRLIDAFWLRMPALARRLPSKAPEYDEADGGVPRDMEDGAVDEEGWVGWRVLPSRVTPAELAVVDERYGPLPLYLRAYLAARCHLLEPFPLEEGFVGLPESPSDDPLGPATTVFASWPELGPAGYLPVGDFGEGAGPICLDRRHEVDGGDFPVVWFDHEALHTLPRDALGTRDAVEPLARPLAPSWRALLMRCLA